jgi:hypothetical protein
MIENLLYTAVATILVIVLLHIGVFWVSRVIQPPKPRVVYMQPPPSPPPAAQQVVYSTLPPLPQATSAPPAPEIKLPTYDSPPPPAAAAAATKPALPSLPPPIETRDASRS